MLNPCPPPPHRIGLGSESRLVLVLGLGVTRQLPPSKIAPWLGLGFPSGLVLELGGNFPWGQLP